MLGLHVGGMRCAVSVWERVCAACVRVAVHIASRLRPSLACLLFRFACMSYMVCLWVLYGCAHARVCLYAAAAQQQQPSPVTKHPFRPGKHQFVAAGQNFVVDSKYIPKTNLGTGAYGVVMCVAHFPNRLVCVVHVCMCVCSCECVVCSRSGVVVAQTKVDVVLWGGWRCL